MDLITYIAASAIAVLALYLINRALGGPRPVKITDPEVAVIALHRDYPGLVTGEILLSDDGRAALIAIPRSRKTGLVVTHGDKLVTRLLGQQDMESAWGVETAKESSLHLRLADPTLPRAEIRLARGGVGSEDDGPLKEMAVWLERLSAPAGLKRGGEMNHGPA